MHHKRKRPKSARAGCLLCKPHKANGNCPRHRNMRFGDFKRHCVGTDQLRGEGVTIAGKWGGTGGW
jgi:hypothetical protein